MKKANRLILILTMTLILVMSMLTVAACNTDDHDDPSDDTYTITVTNGTGGSYTLSEESPVKKNTEVTLTVTPNANYKIKSVKVNGSEVALTENKYTFTVTANTTIIIDYESESTTSPEGTYTVEVQCGAGGTYKLSIPSPVKADARETLTIVPDETHKVNSVKVNGKEVNLTKSKYAFEVKENTVIIIEFTDKFYELGTYPKSKVTDNGIVMQLNGKAGDLPASDNDHGWTDYGYYFSGQKEKYMWYKDIELDGSKYRGVYFTQYRPYDTQAESSAGSSHQDENGYTINTTYWFKFEPIRWRILLSTDEQAYLMSDVALDASPFHSDYTYREIEGEYIYPSNYKHSEIRKWLTETFYNLAFTDEEKAIIDTTEVDNSPGSTGYDENMYACENTNDKVFLVAPADVLDEYFGFGSNEDRQIESTDYSEAQGLYAGDVNWWTRSPDNVNSWCIWQISSEGKVNSFNLPCWIRGVVPALIINLK